jgi:hypothetical protein
MGFFVGLRRSVYHSGPLASTLDASGTGNVTVGEAGQYGVAINYSQFVVKYTCRMVKCTRAEYLVSPTIRLSLQRSYRMRLDCDALEYSTRLTVLILIMGGLATGSSHYALKKRTYARKPYVHVMH